MSTNNEPVGLPAGSYDYDELKKALGEASRVSADERHQAVTKAIEATNKSPFDPNREPGYETVEQVSEATGATENIQVFVGVEPEPKTAGEATTSNTKPSAKPDATKE